MALYFVAAIATVQVSFCEVKEVDLLRSFTIEVAVSRDYCSWLVTMNISLVKQIAYKLFQLLAFC